MTGTTTLADVDLTDLDHFAHGFPHQLFALHRREAPVWWHEPTAHTPDGEGFWSVATYAEAVQVLRDPVTFSSEQGGTLLQDMGATGSVLTMMDDPRHARIRRLVSAGLTPRMVARLEDDLRRRTLALLDAIDGGRRWRHRRGRGRRFSHPRGGRAAGPGHLHATLADTEPPKLSDVELSRSSSSCSRPGPTPPATPSPAGCSRS